VCQEDDLGHHSVGVEDNLLKSRINKNGKKIKGKLERDEDSVRKAVDEGEGCRLEGFLDVAKVPGDFHLSYHAHRDLLEYLTFH
jgi:endoplasmic reticulum-Golgi intermediate compartment protein 1